MSSRMPHIFNLSYCVLAAFACSSVPQFSLSGEGGLEASLDFFGEILSRRVRSGGHCRYRQAHSIRLSHCWGSHHLVRGAPARGLHIKVTFLFVVHLLRDEVPSPQECFASPTTFHPCFQPEFIIVLGLPNGALFPLSLELGTFHREEIPPPQSHPLGKVLSLL